MSSTNNNFVSVTREKIENGTGFEPDVLWFVDCDGYSFGTYDTEQEACTKRSWLHEQLGYGWTAREIYRGESGSTERVA